MDDVRDPHLCAECGHHAADHTLAEWVAHHNRVPLAVAEAVLAAARERRRVRRNQQN